jgi:predicted GNAT family N-acyltransferase
MSEQAHKRPYVARVAATAADLESAFAVRWRVFVEGQGVPAELERDAHDDGAIHAIAEAGGAVVAAGRLIMENGEPRIGRIAVLPDWRRQGVAGSLLDVLEREAAAAGHSAVSLHSQEYIQALYAARGYVVTGAPFVEAGIDHLPMEKRLTS